MSSPSIGTFVRSHALTDYRSIQLFTLEQLQTTTHKSQAQILKEIQDIARAVFEALEAQAQVNRKRISQGVSLGSMNDNTTRMIEEMALQQLAPFFKNKFERSGSFIELIDTILADSYSASLIRLAAEELIKKKQKEPAFILQAIEDDDIHYFSLLSSIIKNSVDKL